MSTLLTGESAMWRPCIGTIVCLFGLLIGGCTSTSKTVKEEDASVQNSEPEPIVGAANEIVTKYDLNKDKRPDLWRIYVKGSDLKVKADRVLIRVEIDLNADGKIDVRRFYNAEGSKIRERFDLDYDGKFDMENFYHQDVVHKQAYYLRSKKRPDVFKFFEVVGKKKNRQVRLVRKERDTNLDGRVDYWEYWENGRLDRIGRDTDYDGKVDVWEKGSDDE